MPGPQSSGSGDVSPIWGNVKYRRKFTAEPHIRAAAPFIEELRESTHCRPTFSVTQAYRQRKLCHQPISCWCQLKNSPPPSAVQGTAFQAHATVKKSGKSSPGVGILACDPKHLLIRSGYPHNQKTFGGLSEGTPQMTLPRTYRALHNIRRPGAVWCHPARGVQHKPKNHHSQR